MPVYGAGARVRDARERGGPQPRAGRTLERGENLLEGSAAPRAGRCPTEGCVQPRTRRSPFRGDPCVGRLDGPSESLWAVSCMVRHLHGLGLILSGFVLGFKWVFPHCLRGPLGLSPTVFGNLLEPNTQKQMPLGAQSVENL
jgi:hypothetical protein